MSTNRASVRVDYDWTNYQAYVRDELEGGDHDVVVLRTGYGGGKSRCGGQWIHRGAIADRAGAGESLVLAQDYQKGKSTTYSVFFKILPGEDTNPYKNGDPENSPLIDTWHSNDKRLVYVSGHVAWLGGADKWNRFAGGEYCRIWCDEVGHYPPTTDLYDLHEMLVTRQRTDLGPNTTLWTSTGNGYNQFYDITERQVDKDGEPLPWRDRLHVVTASTEQNTLMPADGLEKIVRQFKGTPREQQGLHGGFAAAEGLVYSQFSRKRHVKDRAWVDQHVDEAATPIYGYDAGWDHPRVFVEWWPTVRDRWVATDLYYESGREFEHLCDPRDQSGWVFNNDKPRTTVYAEHEPEHIRKLQRAGFTVHKARKSLDEGIPHLRGLLKPNDQGEPGLLVSVDCTHLIQEFQSYKEEHVGAGGDVPDHALDATRYCLFTHSQRVSGQNQGRDSGGISFR
jgi:hypothetical protein